jgi:hypothetical protein
VRDSARTTAPASLPTPLRWRRECCLRCG